MKKTICSKNKTIYKEKLIFDKSTKLINSFSYSKNDIPKDRLKNKSLRTISMGSLFNLSI
jgi:hypothetical protein